MHETDAVAHDAGTIGAAASPVPDPVQVVGEGLLAGAIAEAAAERTGVVPVPGPLPRPPVTSGSAVVVASDGWDTGTYPEVRRTCAGAGVPWLPVRAELGRVVLGPVELPDGQGCGVCAELRRSLAHANPEGHDAVRRRHADALAGRPSAWLTRLAADLVGALVLDELAALATAADAARTRQALICVALDSLRVTAHRFLPDPRCVECGDLPDDAPSLAEIVLLPRPKTDPRQFRIYPPGTTDLKSLADTYVDAECGLVRTVYRDSEAGFATASAPMRLRGDTTVLGVGRTPSFTLSRLVALLEALERYAGTQPGGKRTVVHGSYAELGDQALDPRTLGLYPPERYRPGFPFRPFTEDARCNWVWGYSFARGAPILVPETAVYYRMPQSVEPGKQPFAYELSSGCALGNCLEEAILYGLLEVAERDAFLLTWHARLPVPRIDLESATDYRIPLLAELMREETGYEINAFDITMEHGIPSVWAMAFHPGDDPDLPKAACAADSHPDPERAVKNALSELGPHLSRFMVSYPYQRQQAREMAEDSSRVVEMNHHTLLYGNPEVFPRLAFLTGSTGVRRLPEMARVPPQPDLRGDLEGFVRRYLDSGLDVIVVDQTIPELRWGGFAAAKVLIPGTLPMSFGHEYRRVDGMPRLYEVPHQLGYHERPLRPEEVNLHPHPFP